MEIQEYPQKKEVKINKNFRLLWICNYNSISKMSPAFLNRFDIITLEDQIKPLSKMINSEKYFLDFIGILLKQHSYNYQLNIKQNKEDKVQKEKIAKFKRFLDGDNIEKELN